MLQVRPRKKKQRQKIHKQYYIKHNHKRQNHPQRKPQNTMHAQNLHKQVQLLLTQDSTLIWTKNREILGDLILF